MTPTPDKLAIPEAAVMAPDTTASTSAEVVPVYWIFTDPETGMECGMHDEARGASFREQHRTWPETHLFAQSALDAMRAERDEAHAGWRNASELLDAAVGDYNTEQARAQALEAEVADLKAKLAMARASLRPFADAAVAMEISGCPVANVVDANECENARTTLAAIGETGK